MHKTFRLHLVGRKLFKPRKFTCTFAPHVLTFFECFAFFGFLFLVSCPACSGGYWRLSWESWGGSWGPGWGTQGPPRKGHRTVVICCCEGPSWLPCCSRAVSGGVLTPLFGTHRLDLALGRQTGTRIAFSRRFLSFVQKPRVFTGSGEAAFFLFFVGAS